MEYSVIQDVLTRGLYLTIILTIVIISPGMILGLIISVFQAATQINESSVNFVPKLLLTILFLAFTGGWIFSQISEFYHYIMANLQSFME